MAGKATSRSKTRTKSGINIKPSNKGKMRKTAGTKQGHKIPIKTLQKLKKSKNPTTRKRATFALNVRQGKFGGNK